VSASRLLLIGDTKTLYALKMNPHQQLRGVTEADETFFRYSEKGSRKLSRPPRKRGGGMGPGLDDELVCVLTAKVRSGSSPVIETVEEDRSLPREFTKS